MCKSSILINYYLLNLSAFDHVSVFQRTNVILLATIYPLSLAGQYLRSVGGADSWYPLECFLVACERLYGKAKCYAAYGENIRSSDRERTSKEERLIVGKVKDVGPLNMI